MMIDDLFVGCAVRSKRAFPAINVLEGEKGWVYETYTIGDHRGVSVIFERGGYDGFGEDTIDDFLEDLGEFDSRHAEYAFRGVMWVTEDYEKGFWDFR